MARNNKKPQPPVISNLSVKYFRGIADKQCIDFNKKGKIVVLYGENGTGKSSFVNAMEYLFKGELDLLKSQSISKKQKPALHYGREEDDWEIKVSFNGNRYALRNKGGLNTDKNLKKLIKNNYSFFNNTSFILDRKKLLKFINDTEGKRFNTISELCGFDDVEPIQKTFNQTEKYYKNLLNQNISNLNNIENEILNILNINDKDDIYVELNKNLLMLNKELIDENTDLEAYLDNFDISSQLYIIKRDINEFNKIYESLELDNLDEKLSNIIQDYGQAGVDSLSFIKTSADFLNQSLSFINTYNLDVCPICERKLNEDILNSITEKISIFEDNLKNFNKIESEIKLFQKLLKRNIQTIDKLINNLENFSNIDSEIELLENYKTSFVNLSKDCTDLINFKLTAFDLKEKYKLNIKKEFDVIKDKVNEFDEKKKDDNFTKLKTIKSSIEKLIEYVALKQEIPAIYSKYELTSKLKEKFSKSKEDYINNLIDEIEEDVDEFYSFIHEDDEISSIDMSLRSSSRLRFYINSFGQKADPRSFSSEGHLDSLGICIFLAFMKKINPLNFIVLDDVITSVDLTHKDKIARLLVSNFKTYKILITTHNPLWAEQLQRICEGYGRNYEILQITNWELGVGPYIKNHVNTPEKINEYLKNYEYNAAANTSRRFLEYSLSDFCENHSVNLKLKEKYSAGELKDSVEVKSKELVNKTNLEEYLNYLWMEFGFYNYIGNKLSHHNNDAYLLTGPEVVPFCNLVIELDIALNHCIDCDYNFELIFDTTTKGVKCSEKCKFKTF